MVSNETKKRTGVSRKLLAAVAVFAMVAAAFAVVGFSADDSVAAGTDSSIADATITPVNNVVVAEDPAEFATAIAEVNGDNTAGIKTIKLGGTIDLTSTAATISKSVTLDLNGQTITCSGQALVVAGEGTVVSIVNSDQTATGKIVNSSGAASTVDVQAGAKLTVTFFTFDSSGVYNGIEIVHPSGQSSVTGAGAVEISGNFIGTNNATAHSNYFGELDATKLSIADDATVPQSKVSGGFTMLGDNITFTEGMWNAAGTTTGIKLTQDNSVIKFSTTGISGTPNDIVFAFTGAKTSVTFEGALNSHDDNKVKVSSDTPVVFNNLGNAGKLVFNDAVIKNATFDGAVTLTDVKLLGKNTFNGALTIATGLEVAKGARVYIEAGASSSKITNYGTIYLNDGNITSDIDNKGTVKVNAKTVNITGKVTGTPIDFSAVASEGVIGGNMDKGKFTYDQYQTITAVKDVVLVDDAFYEFKGKFVVPEGVTVTVKQGAYLKMEGQFGVLENNGAIVIESTEAGHGLWIDGGKVFNNGTITTAVAEANAGTAIAFNAGVFENKGTITVGKFATMVVADTLVIDNKADAKIVVDGTLDFTDSASINNEGSVTVNGATTVDTPANTVIKNKSAVVVNGTFVGTVDLLKADATVDVKLLGINSDMTVKNAGIVKTGLTGNDDSVAIETDADETLAGIVIGTRIVSAGSNAFTADMIVSGNAVAGTVGTSPSVGGVTIAFTNTAAIADKLAVNANVKIQNNNTLAVEGEMTIALGGALNDSDVTVTGKLTISKTGAEVNGIKAAMYSKDVAAATPQPAYKIFYYTTLDNALAAGEKNIKVRLVGEYTFDKDVVLPADTKIDFTGTDGVIIKDGVTVTVADKALITVDNDLTVNGTLVLENSATGVNDLEYVKSEVKSTEGSKVIYTSLVNALNNAVAGQTITVQEGVSAKIHKNAAIKDGVTLQINSGDEVILNKNVTFTIDGTLFLNDGVYNYEAADAAEKAKIVLNGMIKSTGDMAGDSKYPAGAYYTISEMSNVTYFIKPLEDAVADIATYDGQTIEVYGEVKVGDIAIIGTEAKPATVIVNDKFTAGTITMDFAALRIADAFTGTVTNGAGSVAMKNVNTFDAVSAADKGAKKLTISGTSTIAAGGSVVFNDAVTLNGFNTSAATVEGNVKVAGTSAIDTLVVNGTVDVAKNAALNTDNLTVFGTVNATEENSAVDVDFNLYIGVDKKAIGLAGTAAANGNFTVDGITYAAPGATVPANIAKLGSVTYKIDGKVLVVAYAKDTVKIDELKPVIEDALYGGWNGLVVGTTQFPAEGKNLDLTVKQTKNIYDVIVYADEGIGTVAIDGNVMANEMGNKFTLVGEKLVAGVHEITFKFKEGYDGKVTMTVDGKAVDGLKFTASGTFGKTAAPVHGYVINLQGANPVEPIVPPTPVPPTPVPPAPVEPADDGLTVTDYLLIVLVVLIAIMTIMVAMKLMRS